MKTVFIIGGHNAGKWVTVEPRVNFVVLPDQGPPTCCTPNPVSPTATYTRYKIITVRVPLGERYFAVRDANADPIQLLMEAYVSNLKADNP